MMQSNIGLVVEDPDSKPVDREKTCPLLLRVFCSSNRHNFVQEYSRGAVPANELQIYTWMDCTLRELTGLIKEVNPDARRRGTLYEYAIIFPDNMRPDYRMRVIGSTCAGQPGPDDHLTLQQCKFQIGDYIDVAITVPGMRGPPPGGPRGGRGRYNDRY